MKIFLLRETAPMSGLFSLTTDVLDSSPAEAAAACVERQAAEHARFAMLPYEALRQVLEAAAVPTPSAVASTPPAKAAAADAAPPAKA
jgi:hypothetical protein